MKLSTRLSGILHPPGPVHRVAQTQVPNGGCTVKTTPSSSIISGASAPGLVPEAENRRRTRGSSLSRESSWRDSPQQPAQIWVAIEGGPVCSLEHQGRLPGGGEMSLKRDKVGMDSWPRIVSKERRLKITSSNLLILEIRKQAERGSEFKVMWPNKGKIRQEG